MKTDSHHLQIRLPSKSRKELRRISRQMGLPASDVVRSALFFGLPLVTAMNKVQGELVKRLAKKIKSEARQPRSRRRGK